MRDLRAFAASMSKAPPAMSVVQEELWWTDVRPSDAKPAEVAAPVADYRDEIPNVPGHYVYRLWTHDGTPLYIGLTGRKVPRSPEDRFREHAHQSGWWKKVAHKDVRWFPDPATAAAEELQQIRYWRPVHNKNGLPTPWMVGSHRPSPRRMVNPSSPRIPELAQVWITEYSDVEW